MATLSDDNIKMKGDVAEKYKELQQMKEENKRLQNELQEQE